MLHNQSNIKHQHNDNGTSSIHQWCCYESLIWITTTCMTNSLIQVWQLGLWVEKFPPGNLFHFSINFRNDFTSNFLSNLADNCICLQQHFSKAFTASVDYSNIHRESKKTCHKTCLYLHQILTDFKNSFTGTLCGKFAVT